MAPSSKPKNIKSDKAQSVDINVTDSLVDKPPKDTLKNPTKIKTTKTLKNKKKPLHLSIQSIIDSAKNIGKTRSTRSTIVEHLSTDNKNAEPEQENAKLSSKKKSRKNNDQDIPKQEISNMMKDFNNAVAKAHFSKNKISKVVQSSIHDISSNKSNLVGSINTNKHIEQSGTASILNNKSSNVTKTNATLETLAITDLGSSVSKSVKMSKIKKKNGTSSSSSTRKHLRSSLVKSTNEHAFSIKHQENGSDIEKNTDKAKPHTEKSKKRPLPTMTRSTRSNTTIEHDINEPFSKTEPVKVKKIIQIKELKSSQPQYESMDKKNESSDKPQFVGSSKANEKKIKKKGVQVDNNTKCIQGEKTVDKDLNISSRTRTSIGLKRASDFPISNAVTKRSKHDSSSSISRGVTQNGSKLTVAIDSKTTFGSSKNKLK